jgi:hypothetical protein
MPIPIKVDTSGATKDLTELQRNQIPYAASRAINKVAGKVADAERSAINQVFDRPTPFTQGSIFVSTSHKSQTPIEAIVGVKEDAAKGTPASKYLAPEVFGGPRRAKRMEKALTNAGYLPAGFYVVPAKGLPLDQYGNITPGLATKILSGLQASFDPRQNKPRKRRGTAPQGDQYFVGKPAGGRFPEGIWVRNGRTLKMLLLFVKQPTYNKRFDFFEIARTVAVAEWPKAFDEFLAQALATAR